jgi:uracil-DNA glycosylase family 4
VTTAFSEAPQAPKLSALRRLWLREIGIDKLPGAAVAAGRPAVNTSHRPAQQNPSPEIRTDKRVPAATQNAVATDGALGSGDPEAGHPAPGDLEVDQSASSHSSPVSAPAAAQASQDTGNSAAAKPVRRGPDLGREAIESARAAAVAAGHRRQGTAPTEPVPAGPRLSAAELLALDLDTLREHVSACTACGLCAGRRNAVFGEGVRAPRWMVVGEAPGEQEDRKGEPFVGRAGQLLDDMLRAVGMSRETDVFIANVIKCRPPANRNPKPEEIAACSPYLMRQISLLKPERILVVGRFAAQTLLGTDASIGSLRGRVHKLDMDDGRSIPVVVSYHPAYLLRSPAEKAHAWQDLRLALSLV